MFRHSGRNNNRFLNGVQLRLKKYMDKQVWCKRIDTGTSLAVQWLNFMLPLQGVQVQSLVRELRSHPLIGEKSVHSYEDLTQPNQLIHKIFFKTTKQHLYEVKKYNRSFKKRLHLSTPRLWVFVYFVYLFITFFPTKISLGSEENELIQHRATCVGLYKLSVHVPRGCHSHSLGCGWSSLELLLFSMVALAVHLFNT